MAVKTQLKPVRKAMSIYSRNRINDFVKSTVLFNTYMKSHKLAFIDLNQDNISASVKKIITASQPVIHWAEYLVKVDFRCHETVKLQRITPNLLYFGDSYNIKMTPHDVIESVVDGPFGMYENEAERARRYTYDRINDLAKTPLSRRYPKAVRIIDRVYGLAVKRGTRSQFYHIFKRSGNIYDCYNINAVVRSLWSIIGQIKTRRSISVQDTAKAVIKRIIHHPYEKYY